jgi:NodT family efflux transporter outer membrane factor (OMF) lipoprotein
MRARRSSRSIISAGLMPGLVLSGCAVGPDFKPPAAPTVQSYEPQPLPAQTESADAPGGEAQRFLEGNDIPEQWWTLFRSPALNELIQQAFHNNPTVQSAQAALREAKENYYAQLGALLPSADAQYSFTRQRNATGTLAPTLSSGESLFNLHTAQVNVSYTLDVFGGARRQAESMRALADSQRFQLEATYLTLASNVVTTAIGEASARAQLAATNDIVRSEREALQILRKQYDLGSIALTDVMAQEATLATTEATVPPLQKQVEQAQHALAVLVGRFPSEGSTQRFELPGIRRSESAGSPAPGDAAEEASLALPQDLPVTVPSRLVRQRPDVLAAEAQLHAATAQVGVAIANMLPQINLTAMEGGASTELSRLFSAGNTFWSGGATLSQTLFAGGALLHKERAARAALDEAGADYRNTVLTAFQDVADTLSALRLDAEAVNAGVRAERAAHESLITIRHNVELGSTGYLALLNAQQTYQQAVVSLEQAETNRYADTVALFQALGGGWWNRASPP